MLALLTILVDSWPERARRFARRVLLGAFVTSLLLALGTSGAIVSERLSGGNVRLALLTDCVVLVLAVVAMSLTARARSVFFGTAGDASVAPVRLRISLVLLVQLLGAAIGVAIVHLVLRKLVNVPTWFRECPAQFVNDAVAVCGALLAVWACARRRLVLGSLVAMFLLLLAYGATASHWHWDHPALSFSMSTQELVAAQVIATATGLLSFRRFQNG
jgi:hypothetical protein